MERFTARVDMGLDEFNEIAFINPHDPEGLYNLRDFANDMSDEELLPLAEKIVAYEDAEEAGLLVRLPCKIGTPCFCIGHHGIYSSVFCYNNIPCFGKTVFLTREEAEAALAKGE